MTNSKVILPDITTVKNAMHREVVEIFLLRFRDKGFLGQQMKTLDAIEKTASLTGQCETKVALILVENGLKAGRRAFPQSFLDHVDNVFFGHHKGQDILASAIYASLKDSWNIQEACIKAEMEDEDRAIAPVAVNEEPVTMLHK